MPTSGDWSTDNRRTSPYVGLRIPLWIKIVYAAFLAVLAPVYWRWYGPSNFLWFSDVALFATFAALLLESPFLASMQAVSVLVLETIWTVDFLVYLTTGVRVVGLSTYMFDSERPLYLRGLSLFHLVLPVLLLWLVARLGYAPRAWLAQTALAWIVLPICYFFTDPSANINWVYGLGDKPQTSLPSGVHLTLQMILFPLVLYFPTHLVLQRVFSSATNKAR